MSASNLDPHDKMRSRDVGRVARGEQAPRPDHKPGTVSPPPQNEPRFRAQKEEAEKTNRPPVTDQTRHCFNRYLQYHKCLERKGRDADECNNLADYVRSLCPQEMIERWDEQRKHGTLPASI